MKLIRLGLSALLVTCLHAEEAGRPPIEELAGHLQGLRAAGPHWADVLNARIKAGEPMPSWIVEKPPPDEAAPAEHLRYWEWVSRWDKQPKPTHAERERLLQGILVNPVSLGEVLPFLPRTPDAAAKVAGILQFFQPPSDESRGSLRQLRAWIYQHGGLMRDQVLDDAKHADWKRYVYDEKPDWALHAIQQREPEVAAGLFAEFAAGTDPGLAVVGARLLLESADEKSSSKWRNQLIATAGNATLPDEVREIAVHALLKAEWKGRFAWMKSFLENTPGDPEWFIREIWKSEKRWIPALIGMTRSKASLARRRAVHLLVRSEASQATLRPLLPWLEEPSWAEEQWASIRLDFLRKFGEVRIPEAIPALERALETEKDAYEIGAAASALAFHRAKNAVPSLKRALARPESSGDTDEIVASIHKLGGFTRTEIISSMERCALLCPTNIERRELGRNDGKPPPPTEVWIGRYFLENPPRGVEFANALAKHIVEFAPGQAQVAAGLLEGLFNASPVDASAATAAVLDVGTISAESMELALRRCRWKNWGVEPFSKLKNREGAVGAYAAVLGRDSKAMHAILSGNHDSARIALLRSARISGEKLDFAKVVRMLDEKNEDLCSAADEYLWDSDDPTARRLELEHSRRNEDVIAWDPDKGTYGGYSNLVRLLADRYGLNRGPAEVFEMSEFNGAGGYTAQTWKVLAYRDFGFMVHETCGGRVGISKISGDQLNGLRGYLRGYRVSDLPDLEQPICDGTSNTFTQATKTGLRNLHMNNPPGARSPTLVKADGFDDDTPYSKGIVIYSRLVDLFEHEFSKLPMEYTYGGNAKVLLPKEIVEISGVWKQGTDLRVMAESRSLGKVWLSVDSSTGKLRGPVTPPQREVSGFVFDESSGKMLPAKEKTDATLQKTFDGKELWVAEGNSYSGKAAESLVWRVNPGTSAKEKVLTLKGLAFDSPGMWVDEAESMIYAAVAGDLVRVPLKSAEK